jgi:hypothetical protein
MVGYDSSDGNVLVHGLQPRRCVCRVGLRECDDRDLAASSGPTLSNAHLRDDVGKLLVRHRVARV